MKVITHKEKPGVSLHDLVAAAGELAFEYAESDADGRRWARVALIEILRSRPNSCGFTGDFPNPGAGGQLLH